jgi:hypothetical protein
MTLVFILALVALALAAPFIGADSRDGQDRRPLWPTRPGAPSSGDDDRAQKRGRRDGSAGPASFPGYERRNSSSALLTSSGWVASRPCGAPSTTT